MEEYTFFAYSWHIDTKITNKTVIRVYGLDKNNENVCIIVNDFCPYVYIELPDVKWNENKIQSLVDKLHDMLDDPPVNCQLKYKKKLYYANLDHKYKRKKYPYLLCNFRNEDSIRKLGRKLIRNPKIRIDNCEGTYSLHEYNAGSILQLTSVRKIPTAGWIKFKGERVPRDQVTYCHHEFIVGWESLEAESSDIIAKPLLMGYDIEVNSSIPSSMPNASRPNDEIFQISCVFARQGSNQDTYEKYLLTLGEPYIKSLGPDIYVCKCKKEEELLVEFTRLILEKQPNIIIGYNIFTFDIPYMIKRAHIKNCTENFGTQGFLIGVSGEVKNIKWSSSAYKNQVFEFLEIEGRVFIDLLPLIKRDYKMNNYKLKTVSSYFLTDMTKDPLQPKGIFECYRLGMAGGKKGQKALSIVGKYCVQDSLLVVKLFEVLTTWVSLCEMSKITNVPIFYIYTRGQQLKLFSQVYKKCTHDNIVVEKGVEENDHYVGATVFPPVPGIYDKVVPFDFSSLYPSTIIAYNICWSTLVIDDSIPDDLCHILTWPEHQLCEHDNKEIRITELTNLINEKCAKIKELRLYNDMVKIEEINRNIKLLREKRVQVKKTRSRYKICCERKYRWLKKPMGVLPGILTHLLNTRAQTRKEMKKIKNDKTYLEVLDKRQSALKVSANSCYGAMGVKKGYLPFMPGAMCTTYGGRLAIQKAANCIVNEHKGTLIYGDTDSNYVSFPHLNTAEECWDYAIKVAKSVTTLFPKPMSLAFEEKIYWRFFILTKKRYMSLACQRNGVLDKKISNKGVLLSRRDNCPYIRNLYEAVITMIFNGAECSNILNYVLDEINKLCGHAYPWSDFVITKSVGNTEYRFPDKNRTHYEIGDYTVYGITDEKGKQCYKIGDYKVKLLSNKTSEMKKQFKLKNCTTMEEYYLRCLPAQVQLAERMKKRGQLVPVGTRLEYVITTAGGHVAKQYVKIESADYFSKHSRALELDYLYYLKQLSNPLDQVLNILYTGKKFFTPNFVLNQYKYRYLIREPVLKEFNKILKSEIIFIQ